MTRNIVDRTRDRYLQYEKRHQEILDAAISTFNARGYRGATTAEIAKTAGISEPILYKHFKNKKDLFLESCQSIADYLFAENSKEYYKYKGDEVRLITSVIKVYFRFLRQNPHKSMFLIHMLSVKNDPEFEGFFENLMKRFVDSFEEILLSAQKKGIYQSKVKPRVLAVIFTSQFLSVVATQALISTKDFSAKNMTLPLLDMLKIGNGD